jgi:hypothetical protein
MDKQMILHKLNKYKLKLESQPNNIIYQNKVTHYGNMVGGMSWERNDNNKHTKTINKNDKKIIYEYNIETKTLNKKIYNGTTNELIDETNFMKDTKFKKKLNNQIRYYNIESIEHNFIKNYNNSIYLYHLYITVKTIIKNNLNQANLSLQQTSRFEVAGEDINADKLLNVKSNDIVV